MTCNLLASPIAMHVLAASSTFFSVCLGKPHHAQNTLTRGECYICRTHFPARQQ